ncbi:hypothetical protein [Oceanibaculum sp.]|nr:hypothetical protein [Oceanibaculum sp.]
MKDDKKNKLAGIVWRSVTLGMLVTAVAGLLLSLSHEPAVIA